ncbi:MAG: L,D-transpeptidase/peptidoglycan binding protein [Eubacterium sp.]|nr:L,D-transpeptidase/peptidoglycan binding protein [Eubacterium sp.]
MKENKKVLIGCITGGVALVALLAVIFILSRNYFGGKFAADTIANGTQVGSMTVDQAVEVLNQAPNCTILVDKDGSQYKVNISQAVNMDYSKDQVQDAKDQISFFSYLLQKTVEVNVQAASVTADSDKIQQLLEEALPEASQETKDAYFDKALNLVEEVQGDNVDYQAFLSQIMSDLQAGKDLNYQLSDYYVKPTVTKDSPEIQAADKAFKDYRKIKITYKFGKKKEVIDSSILAKHLVYKNNKAKLKLDWTAKYVRKLAKKYNTYGKTRTFKTTKDGKIKLKGGILGWWINEEETVKKLNTLLKNKKSKTLEPVYRNGAVKHGKDDVGDTYVEVSISRQHLWFYKNGKLKMESDVVTGLPTAERSTVRGVHRIYGKQTNRYLGTMAVQGYRSFVNYWMPFNWSGQGLHDATWRSRFGGSLYRSGGSHGCVNMPLSNAAKLYGMVSIGTPVIVY